MNNNKVYIGKTRQNLNKRINAHFRNAFNIKCENYNCKFYRAIRKYNKKQFIFTILCNNNNKDILDESLYELEKNYIIEYNSYLKGYNSDMGGNGTRGMIHSEETKLKMRDRALNRKITDNAKQNMSISAKKRITFETNEIFVANTKAINNKSVSVYINNKLIQFDSIANAARSLNLDSSSISKCCKGKIKYCGIINNEKLKWKYNETSSTK